MTLIVVIVGSYNSDSQHSVELKVLTIMLLNVGDVIIVAYSSLTYSFLTIAVNTKGTLSSSLSGVCYGTKRAEME